MKRNSIRQMSRCPGASEFLGFMVLRRILWTKGKLKDVEVFLKELLFCFDFKIEFQRIEIHQDGVLSFPISININLVLIEVDSMDLS